MSKCKKFSKKLIQEKQFLLKICDEYCSYVPPLDRQLANLFCLPRGVAPFTKFKINKEDELNGPLPIGQMSMES